MWKKNIVKLLLFIVFVWVPCIDTTAQSFLGLSINYGDKLRFTPNYPGLLLKRNSFSPTLVYSNQKKFQSDFAVIFGGQVGVAGYQLIPVLRDTLGPSGDHSPFVDYGIFVSRLELHPVRCFILEKENCLSDLAVELAIILYFHLRLWALA